MVTRERFEQGVSYDEFKRRMTKNQERFEANEQAVELSEADLAAFRRLPRRLKVLVLAEDWCGDVVANLPVLGRIAAECGTLDLRVFWRDQNLDLADQYLKDGKYRSIPVCVFFDDDFNQLGRFVERPDSVTALREQKRREFYAANPELGSPDDPLDGLSEVARDKVNQAVQAIRAEVAPFGQQEVVRELRAIVESARATA